MQHDCLQFSRLEAGHRCGSVKIQMSAGLGSFLEPLEEGLFTCLSQLLEAVNIPCFQPRSSAFELAALPLSDGSSTVIFASINFLSTFEDARDEIGPTCIIPC